MRKQEQIEEMANYYCEYCNKQTGEKFCEHIDDKSCNIFFEAELFYNAGYRKIPEDSVVLSREEYKRLLDNAIRVDMEYLDHELAKERKETAKEILDLIVDESGVDLLGAYYKLRIRTYNKIKREYGVGVEE